MVRPAPSRFPVTLGYRQRARFDPNYIHRGIDYGTPSGTPIVATTGGTVTHVGRGGLGPAFGIQVIVKTGGIWHLYAHLSGTSVRVGQHVQAGQRVGFSGATGNVTGAHLHYAEFVAFHYQRDRKPRFISAKPARASYPQYTVVLPHNGAGVALKGHSKGSHSSREKGTIRHGHKVRIKAMGKHWAKTEKNTYIPKKYLRKV